MADYTPIHNPGHEVSLLLSAACTGGQALVVSGSGTVAPGSAASKAFVGIAAQDMASGSKVAVFVGGFVHETVAGGPITAADNLINGAAGSVVTVGAGTPDQVIGVALTTATNGSLVRWIQK
jgi:hypothetical protein